MIVVSRAKYGKYEYSLNPGVLEQLKRLYTKENRKIAEKYGETEALILGMLYSYGVVEYNFYRNKISEFIGENITSKLLEKSDLFDNDIEMEKFMNKYIKWYNNSPQYPLGGYTPNEMVKRFKK